VRSRDSESFRRRLLTGRRKLMHSEPREPSKRAREAPEKEKSWKWQRDRESKPISKKPDRGNSRKRLPHWLSRLELKERTTCIKFRNKSK